MTFNIYLPPYMTRECKRALKIILPRWKKNPHAKFFDIASDASAFISKREVRDALELDFKNEVASKIRDEIWENLSDGRRKVRYHTFSRWMKKIAVFLSDSYESDLDNPNPDFEIDFDELRDNFDPDIYINDSQFMDAARKIFRTLHTAAAFGKSDKDKDGQLSFIEMRDAINKAGVDDISIVRKMWGLANSDGNLTYESVSITEFKQWIQLLKKLIIKQIYSTKFDHKIVTQEMLNYAKDFTFFEILSRVSANSTQLEQHFLTDRPFDVPYLKYPNFKAGIFRCCNIESRYEKEILILWKWANIQQTQIISMRMFIMFLQIVSYVRNYDFEDSDSDIDSDSDDPTNDGPPVVVPITLDPEKPIILRPEDKAILPAKLKRFRLALGWKCDESVDLDSGLVVVRKGKIVESVYYSKLESRQYGICLSGDNTTGEGTGDLETITINLGKVEEALDGKEDNVKLYAVINMFTSGKSFGNSVNKAYVKMVGGVKDNVLAKYKPKIEHKMKLDGNIQTRGLIFCELGYRKRTWVLRALGSQCGGQTCTSTETSEAILRIAAQQQDIPGDESEDNENEDEKRKEKKKLEKERKEKERKEKEEKERKERERREKEKQDMLRRLAEEAAKEAKRKAEEAAKEAQRKAEEEARKKEEANLPGSVTETECTEDKKIILQLYKLFDNDITGRKFWNAIPQKVGIGQEWRSLKDLKDTVDGQKKNGVILKPGKEFFKDILVDKRNQDMFIEQTNFSFWWAYSLTRSGTASPPEWNEKHRFVVLYRQLYEEANTSKKVWESMHLRQMALLDKKCLSELLIKFRMVDASTADQVWEALVNFAGSQMVERKKNEGKRCVNFETFSGFYAKQIKEYLDESVNDADQKHLLHHLWNDIYIRSRSAQRWWAMIPKRNTDWITSEDFVSVTFAQTGGFSDEFEHMWLLLFKRRSKVTFEQFEELWALLLYHFNGEKAHGFSHSRILTIIIKHMFLQYPATGDFWKNLAGNGRLGLPAFQNRLIDDDRIVGLTIKDIRFIWSWSVVESRTEVLSYDALLALLSLISSLKKEDIDEIPEVNRGDLVPRDQKIVYRVVQRTQISMVKIKLDNQALIDLFDMYRREKDLCKVYQFEAHQSMLQMISALKVYQSEYCHCDCKHGKPAKSIETKDQDAKYNEIMKAIQKMQGSIDKVQITLEEGIAKVCQTVINCTMNPEASYIPTYVILLPGRVPEEGMFDFFHSLKAKALDKLKLVHTFHLYACDEGPKLLNKKPLAEPLHEPINLQIPGERLKAMLPLLQALNAILLLAKVAGTLAGLGPLFPEKIPGLENIDKKQGEAIAQSIMETGGFIEAPKHQVEECLDKNGFTNSAVVDPVMKQKALKLVGGAYKAMKMLLQPEDKKSTPTTTDGGTLYSMIGTKIIKVLSPDGKSIHWVHPNWVKDLEDKGYLVVDNRADLNHKEPPADDKACCVVS